MAKATHGPASNINKGFKTGQTQGGPSKGMPTGTPGTLMPGRKFKGPMNAAGNQSPANINKNFEKLKKYTGK